MKTRHIMGLASLPALYAILFHLLAPKTPSVAPDPVWVEVRRNGKVRLQGIGDLDRRLIVRIDRNSIATNEEYGMTCCDSLAIGGNRFWAYGMDDGLSVFLPSTNSSAGGRLENIYFELR